MNSPVIRFRISFSQNCAVDPMMIDLLEAIHRSGSLSHGARDLGMSYRCARRLYDSFKGAFPKPVTRAVRGGPGGGGIFLTEFGAELLNRYRDLEQEFGVLATRRLRSITDVVDSRDSSHESAAVKTSARRM